MNACEYVEALIMPYLNKELSEEETKLMLTHLSTCKRCRLEAAQIIQFKDALQSTMREVPLDVQVSAFDKIKKEQGVDMNSIEFDLHQVVQENLLSPSIATNILGSVLKPIKRTIELSIKNN